MATNKSILSSSIALALGGAVVNADAALVTGATLSWNPGNVGNFGSASAAGPSYWTFPGGPGSTFYTGLQVGPDGGIKIGFSQNATGAHGLYVNGTENPSIDAPWEFLFNTGMHKTTAPVVQSGTLGANTHLLDFSGWAMTWNTIPTIHLGGGFQDCGTSTDGKCGTGTGDISGTFDNGTGVATLVCSLASCSNSSSFVLTYAAKFRQGDPSGFGSGQYGLHLEGIVSSPSAVVPIPAAAWLFGSGLMGLVGVARRRKRKLK